ncbi:MAG: hypothetical protein UZ16_OP3001001564, partial [Candidatus Hinthialibacteria bacterium OLB16]
MDRRDFLKTTIAGGVGISLGNAVSHAAELPLPMQATADSIIFIWLPGGIAQTDTWDPKKHTPYTQGMKGSEILGTCPSIPTKADGIYLGEGLETIASVMDKGAIIRTLTNK